MTVLIAAATGNFTASGSWKKASTVGQVDSESQTINLSTTQDSTPTFTPANTDVIDGIVLKLSSVISPTGTVTIELYNNTAASVAKTITVNASDLPKNGWFCVKFSSTHTPNGTDAYKVRLVRSVADSSSDRLQFLAAGASDYSKYIRITTTAAPADTDRLLMLGEITGAGTSNSFTLTMDRTNTSDSYGAAENTETVSIGKYCTLTFGTAASTNYYFKWKGYFIVWNGGTFNVGTSGTRIPATSTAVLEMGVTTNCQSGFQCLGTLNMAGATKATTRTVMTSDKVATNTVIALSSTAGWNNGDVLAFASTSQNSSEFENKTISTVDNATQVTLSAGLTNAHSGTNPTRCEVGNLTRNIIVRGISGTVQGFVNLSTSSNYSFGGSSGDGAFAQVCNIDYVEFVNLGRAVVSGLTDYRTGIFASLGSPAGSGSVSITNCSLHDFAVAGSVGFGVSGGPIAFTGNVLYKINKYGIVAGYNAVITNNYVIGITVTAGIVFSSGGASGAGLTLTGNTVASCGFGIQLNSFDAASVIDSNTVHSNYSCGFLVLNSPSTLKSTITNSTIWRNGGGLGSAGGCGISLSRCSGWEFDTVTSFGNYDHIVLSAVSDCRFLLVTTSTDASFTPTSFIRFYDLDVNSGTAGTINGPVWIDACTNSDGSTPINFSSIGGIAKVTIRNSTGFASVSGPSPLTYGTYVAHERYEGTAGDHRAKTVNPGSSFGIESDSTTFHTAAPSQKVLTTNGSLMDTAAREIGRGMLYNVNNGETKTPSVWVRQAAGYTGVKPKLILKANPAIGVNRDTVLATATAGTGTWEQLSGTTVAATDDGAFEFVVEGYGGTFNVDDWAG